MLQRITELGRRLAEKARGPREPSWLASVGFRTVLDVGANTGQFADEARGFAPLAKIYSFEPLPDCYEALVRDRKGDPRFQAFPVALGDAPGTTTIHRSAYAPSSSLLAMGKLHEDAFPHTRGGREVPITVETLDGMRSKLDLVAPVLLKIDVQGFEDRVILGATETFPRVDVAVIEMSVEPLYEGQKLFDDVYAMMVARGFSYRGNHQQLRHPRDGRVLQVDGIFVRRP